ncbi:MAG: alanine racemase [Candidatus Abawacabacteria bacterium RBG_16_42_10]|uniref:Alanine racemase n=1 Tax=Candidatus Abawacabacteria bacterium RBG_16_42_10 TaxID=1817814 RepID=A0A1F4XIM6_9BACT|nr:MAG: alanine racemase [Candidatus Abawacabacteria bacterium RBG_16_42_10]
MLSSWLTIDRQAIAHNLQAFRKLLKPQTKLFGVVKSNAYGHGLGILSAVEPLVDGLAVVNVAEGLEIRKRGFKKRVLVLGPFFSHEELLEAQKNNLEIEIVKQEDLTYLRFALPSNLLPPLKVHIKVNTGLNRLGFLPQDLSTILPQLQNNPNIVTQGIFSHLSDAENPASLQTKEQLQSFTEAINSFPESAKNIEKHIAASSATLLFPNSHFDLVRIGISMYGLWPSQETHDAWHAMQPPSSSSTPPSSSSSNLEFRTLRFHSGQALNLELFPALTYQTKIMCIQNVPAGSLVGYGGSYRTRLPSRIATIPVGYYEGLPRSLSNKGKVVTCDKEAPLVGRICMNMAMIDITDIPEATVNSDVTLIGKGISADKQAELAGTISYELLSRIPEHIPRIYS